MYESLRRWTLAILKAPHDPDPPAGDPASLRVFHAGRNYLKLRLAGWAAAQLLALAGLIFWTAFLIDVEAMARERNESPAAAAERKAPAGAAEKIRDAAREIQAESKRRGGSGSWSGWRRFKQACAKMAAGLPGGAFALIWSLKILGGLAYLAQLPLTWTATRLDYEMRWYMVTDRSLRLRHGVWKITESTMSFANIQQVVVSQGPLQRLLGLADVTVKSAGGGGGDNQGHGQTDMHTGHFHSVTNAEEIRDLIRERLRRFREAGAGLGDPDEKPAGRTEGLQQACPLSALEAVRELAAEARALRAAAVAGDPGGER